MTRKELKAAYEAGWRPVISITDDQIVGIAKPDPLIRPACIWVGYWVNKNFIAETIFSNPLTGHWFGFPL